MIWSLTSRVLQETEVGANPVQVEIGEFDEAIDIIEDVVTESKFTNTLTSNQNFNVTVNVLLSPDGW